MNLIGDKFLINDKIVNKEEFLKQYEHSSNNVYEVIRIINSKVLFWEDHFTRLNNSIIKFIGRSIQINDLFEKIKTVLVENNIAQGNVKIEILFHNDQKYTLFVYPIVFYYPNENDKIIVNTFNIERENPNVKTYNYSFKNKVEKFINENKLYEVLMVNKDGYITEGSRTNVYFIKDKYFYTAPIDMVLSGVTRLNVNKLINKLGYYLVEKSILKSSIYEFDGCFLTSTSSNVLPVDVIDGIEINTRENRYVRELMVLFQEYLKYKII